MRKLAVQCLAAVLAGVVVAVLLIVIFPPKARAQENAGAVQLLSEPCRLKDQVVNLPLRATWTQNGKVYEGCWGRHRQSPGVISTFWEDKTVVPILTDQLRPAKPPGVAI